MAIRYYLTKIIGDGLSPATAFRSKVHDVAEANNIKGFTWPKLLPRVCNWCLVKADYPDHTPILADADTDGFPAIALGATITTNQRNAIITALTKRGIDTTFMASVVTFRDLLREVGKIALNRQDFNPDNF